MLRNRLRHKLKSGICLCGVALGFIGWTEPAHAQSGPSFGPQATEVQEEPPIPTEARGDRTATERRLRSLSRSLNAEFSDLARAFRSLDQSFHYRGIVSKKAGTASSAYADWRAQGIDLPRSARIVPPPPRYLGCGQTGDRLCDDRSLFFVPLPRVPECATCVPESSTNLVPHAPIAVAPAPAEAANGIVDSPDLCTVKLQPPVVWQLKPSSTARLNAEGLLAAGMVRVAGVDEAIASAIRDSNACTVRLTASVSSTPAPEKTTLVRLANDRQTHFAIVLKHDRLLLELPVDGETELITLARLSKGPHQVVVCLEPTLVRAWVDGEPATSTRAAEVRFSHWTTGSLSLGSEGFDASKSAAIGRFELSAKPIER